MSLRILNIVTHLTPADAHALLTLLDDVRDALMMTYGPEIKAMLSEARTTWNPGDAEEDDEPF